VKCPKCKPDATPRQRKRWRIRRPIFPVTLLHDKNVPMRRGVESKFVCPNCGGSFVFTSEEMRLAVAFEMITPRAVKFKVGVVA
jgi:hypothetical protein